MRHSKRKEIDGSTWTVNQFSATEGLRLLTLLMKLCGGPIGRAISALKSGGLTSILDSKVDFSLLGEALTELTGRMDEDEIADLVKRLLACTTVDDREQGKLRKLNCGDRFDSVFQGRYLTLFKVLGFVLEVNFDLPLSGWAAAAQAESSGDPEGME